jgi:hypothetical protein
MKSSLKIFAFLFLVSIFSSCTISNLRTETLVGSQAKISPAEKGRQLLQMTYKKMGYDKLHEVEVYETTANFKWSPLWTTMPMNALPGNKNKDVQFRFAADSFDGQVEYLEGGKEGKVYGLQSWESYQQKEAEATVEKLGSKRYPWALATYHYLIEAPMRLQSADIIEYLGETTFNGKSYDLVFVTWGNGDQRTEYDQWKLYINKATGFIDLSEITITDFFLPMPNGMKSGTVQFPERVKTNIGTYLPSKVVIQLGRPKADIEKDVYTFTFRDFKFDSFDKALLYPIDGLTEYGNTKPVARK